MKNNLADQKTDLQQTTDLTRNFSLHDNDFISIIHFFQRLFAFSLICPCFPPIIAVFKTVCTMKARISGIFSPYCFVTTTFPVFTILRSGIKPRIGERG